MPGTHRITGKNILIAGLLVLVLAAGGGATWLWIDRTSVAAERDDLAASNASLRRQLAETQASPATAAATPTPAPSAVALKEFGVSVTVPWQLADLTYSYVAAGATMNFSTAALTKAAATCGPDQKAMGSLTRVAKGKPGPSGAAKTATVGAFDYYYGAPAAACSGTANINEAQTAYAGALRTAIAVLK